jgi:hypothetical protein
VEARPSAVAKRKSDEYSLRWSNGDWLVAHVSDVTGVLSICSAWGSWSYRWNVLHLPKHTLTEFLAARPRDLPYFASKLVPLERQSAVDVRASRTEMKRQLCLLRRSKRIASDDARDCWFEIEEWSGASVPAGIDPSAVRKVWTQEWCDVTERVLPALLEAIAGGSQEAQ